jgi:hypothetical protein
MRFAREKALAVKAPLPSYSNAGQYADVPEYSCSNNTVAPPQVVQIPCKAAWPQTSQKSFKAL